jgi:hypothetical protein
VASITASTCVHAWHGVKLLLMNSGTIFGAGTLNAKFKLLQFRHCHFDTVSAFHEQADGD